MSNENQQPSRIFQIVMQLLPSNAVVSGATLDGETMDDSDYLTMIQDQWGNDNPVAPHIRRVRENAAALNTVDFPERFPTGHTGIPVVFPFKDSGLQLEEADFAAGNHIYILIEDSNGVTTQGFTSVPSDLAKRLPPCIYGNRFTIPVEREDVLNALEQSLNSLAKTLGE